MARLAAPRLVVVAVVLAACVPRCAEAYSVLAHEANVDALWEARIRPLLVTRFPRSTAEQLRDAHAYAYGGSVIQDLGYYPFGSHFFSNLLHYVRTGDFVEALIDESRDVNEYAFALGALAHYMADSVGHPLGVNRAVPLMFPKLRARFGSDVSYGDSPATHVLVEFSFDVLQTAAGAYAPQAYHDFIGFQVAKPVLERAFQRTYGLEMGDVFLFDEDLAIATYRHAIGELIPELTRTAWMQKRDQIATLIPDVAEERFVFRLTRSEYERQFGSDYRKPGLFARFLAVLYKVLPKVGPLRPLKFETPTPEAERLFVDSLKETRERLGAALGKLAGGRLELANVDFDTGKPSVRGEYPLADDTYADLLEKLAAAKFAAVPDALRRNILTFYQREAPAPAPAPSRSDRKRAARIRQHLAVLAATR